MSKGTDFSPVRLMNDVAAGTSNQNSAVLDMAGWDGVIFLTAFGYIGRMEIDGQPVLAEAFARLKLA